MAERPFEQPVEDEESDDEEQTDAVSPLCDQKILEFVQENPKSGKSRGRYELYKGAQTISEFL